MRRSEIAEKFNNSKQKIRKDMWEYIGISIIFVLTIILFYLEIDDMNQIRIVDNPTFTGEVINKETSSFPPWGGVAIHQSYRLHIVGEYINGGETVQIDRVFKVSSSWYERFEVGDLIYHSPPIDVQEIFIGVTVGFRSL